MNWCIALAMKRKKTSKKFQLNENNLIMHYEQINPEKIKGKNKTNSLSLSP